MNTTTIAENEFRNRLRHATRARRSWVSASEVAGDLCHAARALKKIADPERRFECLCDFIFKGGNMLKSVDDSNASLQSVFWDGDVASRLWDETAPLVADKGKIVQLLLKLYDKGWDRIVFRSVLEWNRLYLPEDRLAELRDAIRDRIRTDRYAKQYHRDIPAQIWAQCGDVERFDEYVRGTLRLRVEDVWASRLVVLVSCNRWEEAESLVRAYAPPYAVRHHLLDLARKRGDGDALLAAYKENFASHIDIRILHEAKKELPDAAFGALVRHIAETGGNGPFLDPAYATVLLENGIRDRLREHLLAHRNDDIGKMSAVTGFFPLGTALEKAGEPLLATIPIRLGVLYLMSQSNSKYYPTVHRKMAELEDLADLVTDWGPVRPHSDFDNDFREAFASRRSYWT